MKQEKIEEKKLTCCLCGRTIYLGRGNNPNGIILKRKSNGKFAIPNFKSEDRCCDYCNMQVINDRITTVRIFGLYEELATDEYYSKDKFTLR